MVRLVMQSHDASQEEHLATGVLVQGALMWVRRFKHCVESCWMYLPFAICTFKAFTTCNIEATMLKQVICVWADAASIVMQYGFSLSSDKRQLLHWDSM